MGTLHPAWIPKGYTRLIETGTHRGRSVKRVAGIFQQIDAIELNPAIFAKTSKRLSQPSYAHVHCWQGSSPKLLQLLIDPNVPTVFWLDAHYFDLVGLPEPGVPQCPLIDELTVIFLARWATPPLILIDDARMFGEAFWETNTWPHYDRRQWPTVSEIAQLAGSHWYKCEVLPAEDILRVRMA